MQIPIEGESTYENFAQSIRFRSFLLKRAGWGGGKGEKLISEKITSDMLIRLGVNISLTASIKISSQFWHR